MSGGRRGLERVCHGFLLLVVVATVVPLVKGRYTFFLDHVVGPGWKPWHQTVYVMDNAAYGGHHLRDAFIWVAHTIGSVGAGQAVMIVAVNVLLAGGAYVVLRGTDPVARTFGAVLVLVNPFVYSRILVGHWLFLWGLGMLLPVIAAVHWYIRDGSRSALLASVVGISLLAFDSHALFLAVVPLGMLAVASGRREKSLVPVTRGAVVVLASLLVNSYWLLPALVTGGSLPVRSTGVQTYAPSSDVLTALFSAASMHGFWREGIVYGSELVPATHLLFPVILFLAIHGVLTHYDDPARAPVVTALVVSWLVGVLLGAGVYGPAAPVFRLAFENVPFFAGMRDSNKFVALVVIAYGYLGALGVESLVPEWEWSGRAEVGTLSRADRRSLLRLGAVVLVLVAPIAYSFPMVTGYHGQVASQDYPEGWYEVKGYVDAPSREDGAVLFLPWHQYMDFSWVEKRDERIVTPARAFFDSPVIQGDNVETGTFTTSTNPVSRYVEFLFGLGPQYEEQTISNMGELLTHIDVKYVLVTKETDWRYYDAILRNQSDVRLVMENENFKVYRNDHDVHRAWATDEVRFVQDWDAFVNRSRTEDTTDAVYVVEPERAPAGMSRNDTHREAITATRVSPARYELEGTDARYTVFTQRQSLYADSWTYDGADPVYRHLGMGPVFPSKEDGGTVRYETFSRMYVLGYLVSLLTLSALVGIVFMERRDEFEDVRERFHDRP